MLEPEDPRGLAGGRPAGGRAPLGGHGVRVRPRGEDLVVARLDPVGELGRIEHDQLVVALGVGVHIGQRQRAEGDLWSFLGPRDRRVLEWVVVLGEPHPA